MTDKEKIGKMIKAERKRRKITQTQLADKLKTNRTSVSDWEKGKALPVATLFVALVKELKLDVYKM